MHWKMWVVIGLAPLIVWYLYTFITMKCKTDKPLMQDLHKPGE